MGTLREAVFGKSYKTKQADEKDGDKLSRREAQVVGASSAGTRAVLYQFTTMWMRNPAKLFRPARFDIMGPARAAMQGELKGKPYSWKTHSTAAILYKSIKREGWDFIPRNVLPPIIANSVIGGVLYTTYLVCLQYYTGSATNMDPHPSDTFRSGFIAGGVSSVLASPLDTLYARASFSDLATGEHTTNIVRYGLKKVKEVGPVGLFAGFGLNFIRESLGFATYFSVFETIKNQGYHKTKAIMDQGADLRTKVFGTDPETEKRRKRSRKALQLTFILLAGSAASAALLAVQYPLIRLQQVHMGRLEALDISEGRATRSNRKWFRIYWRSYIQTFDLVWENYRRSGQTPIRFMYKGFKRTMLANLPSSSMGLLVFEIMRQRFASMAEEKLAPT